MWEGTPALVTGATGFIGAHLVRRLATLGARVHAVSRRPRASEHGERWHAADLGDPAATTELVAEAAPEVVFHLASEVTGVREPDAVAPTLAANLTAAVNLLTAVTRSEEHTSELQSRENLVCRLLLQKNSSIYLYRTIT